MIDSYLDILAVLAFAPFAAFVLLYLTVPWWANAAGRSGMLLSVVAALALSSPVWRQITGAPPPLWYRLAVFVLIIVAGWVQLVTLIVVIRRGRRELSLSTPRATGERRERNGGPR